MSEESNNAYWKANLKLMAWLLSVWFLVSFGAGILMVEVLNQYQIGSVKLGFWMAQQGALYTFLLLIWVYIWRMKKLDKKYQVED